jgi:branched-chain amino acid transport system substrate-binding protein
VRRRIGVSLLAAAAATLLAATAAQSRPTAGKTINIGWVGDKSGPTVASQGPGLHAMESYFRMVNDAGGISGDKINFIEKDDGFSPAKELELAKGLISDDKVIALMGISNASGYASMLPLLNSEKVVGLTGQGTIKDLSDPFQPWVFEGNCNYADQADVALGFEMTHLKLKNLKGIKVGIAAIAAASGQEWTDALSAHITKLGGTPVVESIPTAVVNADVQAQAFADAKVKFILMHHAVNGAIPMMKSLAKFGVDVPISGPYSISQPIVWTSSPYAAGKNLTGTNCVSPPLYVKSKKGKLAYATGKKYGVSESDLVQANYSLGWVQAQVMVQGLRNAKGNYTSDALRKGLEQIKNLDTGDLSPKITLSSNCHMPLRQVRPYVYSYSKDALTPVGSYAQWSKFITNAQAEPGTCGKPKA